MKNHELLDIIGEANEDHVLDADSNVIRPRFRWKTLAACAACAALALCAYPAYRAFNTAAQSADVNDASLPLHAYTLVEGGGSGPTAQADVKAPAGGADAFEDALEGEDESIPVPAPVPGGMPGRSYTSGDSGAPYEESSQPAIGPDADGTRIDGPWEDIPVQPAAEWYDALLHTCRLEEHPEWYGGAWLAGDELLAVAIVDGFRTSELETEITQAAGSGAALRFSTVKYSMEFLYGLMEPASRALDGSGPCSIGVDVTANCLEVDVYSDGQDISDDVLAALAHLDPDGDAIRVRVFAGTLSTQDDVVK